jgi:hypothetical protein
METRGGTWATRVKATEHSMIVVNDRPLSLTRYSFSLFYTYILYVHAPGVNSGSKDTTGLVWPEVIPALYQYVLQASQGLEVIPTLYQFYTTFKSQMYPRDFIHIPIKNQSWNHVSISLGRLPRWTKLSEPVPVQLCNRNQVPSLSPDGFSLRGEGASNKVQLKEHTWHHLVLHHSNFSYANVMLVPTGFSFEMPTLF